jgi:translation initiation factor IF-2
MRLYEFSKESGVSSKELLELLSQNGFEVKSHMSVLTPSALDFLTKKYKQPQSKPAEKEAELIVASSKKAEESVSQSKKNSPPASQQPVAAGRKEIQRQPEKTLSEKKDHPMHAQAQPQKSTHQSNQSITGISGLTVEQKIQEPEITEIEIDSMLLSDAASKMKKPVNDIILTLLKWGIVANKNQIIGEDVVARLASHYQLKAVVRPTAKKHQTVTKDQISVDTGEFTERLPVVVVIGHVDHGKTTLLDFIRKTRVAAKEKGGITQHIGAYEAQTQHGNLVFLDTPGHEAFSKIRARGLKVADVAILVVAADDGIMPQTVEAIKYAKSMEVPIVVAVNKIDKVDAARIEIIKRQLAQQDLLPEDWGGQTVVVPISAKEGKNIDKLLDMVFLQAQLMELKADVKGSAKGYVLESKIEKGRGPVATVICQHGILKVGDYFVCGSVSGRVSSLVNSYGQRLQEAGPSIPVIVAGFDALPEVGDYFESGSKESLRRSAPVAEKTIMQARSSAKENAINIIVKTDTNSSKEALIESIEKLSKKTPKPFVVVHSGVGSVSESDVMLAADTGSRIIALHLKVDQSIIALAQRNKVSIEQHFIIYKLLEALEESAQGAKEVKFVRKKIGEAGVLKVFDIKNLGVIAGAYLKDGRFSKDGSVIIYRGNRKIGEGKIVSLQRDKKAVKEVHAGFECAFMVEGISDWQIDDRVECYLDVPDQQK